MYNDNYKYVEVKIEKNDTAYEDLCEDLECWTEHLYPVDRKDSTIYKGLLKLKEFKHFQLLLQASPYSRGYFVKVDGRSDDYCPWKQKGLA